MVIVLNRAVSLQQLLAAAANRRVFMNAPRQVDEEARRRSEAATQQLMRKYEGGSSVGVKLMAKMGYGAAGNMHTAIRQTWALLLQDCILGLLCNSNLGCKVPSRANTGLKSKPAGGPS